MPKTDRQTKKRTTIKRKCFFGVIFLFDKKNILTASVRVTYCIHCLVRSSWLDRRTFQPHTQHCYPDIPPSALVCRFPTASGSFRVVLALQLNTKTVLNCLKLFATKYKNSFKLFKTLFVNTLVRIIFEDFFMFFYNQDGY